MFCLVSTYISWSSLSLPTPRMRKTSDSCMASAAHPLVTWHSYRLFRICSFTPVIIIGRPPLHGNRRYPRGGVYPRGEVWCVQQWDSSVSQCRHSKLDKQITLLLVVKFNMSAYILSQLQNNRGDSGCVSYFKTTCQLRFMLACVCVLIASHRTASIMRVSTKLALPRHWPW